MNKKIHFIDKEKLNQLYFVENKTLKEVAKILKCSEFTVFTNIKKQNIRRRSVSEAMKMSWSKRLSLSDNNLQ